MVYDYLKKKLTTVFCTSQWSTGSGSGLIIQNWIRQNNSDQSDLDLNHFLKWLNSYSFLFCTRESPIHRVACNCVCTLCAVLYPFLTKLSQIPCILILIFRTILLKNLPAMKTRMTTGLIVVSSMLILRMSRLLEDDSSAPRGLNISKHGCCA